MHQMRFSGLYFSSGRSGGGKFRDWEHRGNVQLFGHGWCRRVKGVGFVDRAGTMSRLKHGHEPTKIDITGDDYNGDRCKQQVFS